MSAGNLYTEAEKVGLEVVERGYGHYQIRGGPLLVNYYPESRRRTLYIAGMKQSVPHVTPKQAVEIALDPSTLPGLGSKKEKRRQSKAAKYRRRRFKKARQEGRTTIPCHWCGNELSQGAATVDHIVPLELGGLDHHNNYCIACKPCNHEKANNMPRRKPYEQDQS